jgi:hypothetical protein
MIFDDWPMTIYRFIFADFRAMSIFTGFTACLSGSLAPDSDGSLPSRDIPHGKT